jgi:hypothetical protein
MRNVVICPIARAVHCTGCFLVKICPAKTVLGDYGKDAAPLVTAEVEKPLERESTKLDEQIQ